MITKLFFVFALVSTSVSHAFDVEGRWVSGCHVKNERQAIGLLKFEDDILLENWNYYDDEHCLKPSMSVVIKLKINLIEGSETSPIKIDDTMMETHIVVRDLGVVKYFNSVSFCGHSDWAVGKRVDVTGVQSCGMPSEGTKFYSIVGFENGRLFTAKTTETLDGSAPEKRPDELNLENPFLKIFE